MTARDAGGVTPEELARWTAHEDSLHGYPKRDCKVCRLIDALVSLREHHASIHTEQCEWLAPPPEVPSG